MGWIRSERLRLYWSGYPGWEWGKGVLKDEVEVSNRRKEYFERLLDVLNEREVEGSFPGMVSVRSERKLLVGEH